MRKILLALLIASIGLAPISANAAPKLKTSKAIRIGYFANVTHAPALVAKDKGLIEKYVSKQGTKVDWVAFNAGPSAIEALKGNAIDLAFLGPSPAISGFASTRGSLLRIIAGSTANGAQLIVRSGISTTEDLRGKKIATPQLGNTQDVALRAWLASKGFKTSIIGQGDVTIIPTENAQTFALFQRGDIDGAWVPEPWASRLVLEGNGVVFLDEKNLWPNKLFLTTHLVAATGFLNKYPDTVTSVLLGHIEAVDFVNKNAPAAKDAVQNQIALATGKRLSDAVIDRAWINLRFLLDPLAASLRKNADDAVDAGLLTNLGARGISGIYDLRLLNKIQKGLKKKPYSAQNLGKS